MKRIFILFLLVVFLVASGLFVVREGQRALVLRLGEITTYSDGKVVVVKPGIHFKWPLIEKVNKFDIRLQTLDVQSSRILTAEQKYVLVDYYVKWRINNLALYFKRTGGNSMQAEVLLQQKVNDALRAEFGTHTIKKVISDNREEIMTVLRNKASSSAKGLGISIIDVRIKRIDLPSEVSLLLLAIAEEVVAKIIAKGLKVAAKIYANAYNNDSDFYGFYRRLLAYKNIFYDKHSILVLKPEGQFFKYFNQEK